MNDVSDVIHFEFQDGTAVWMQAAPSPDPLRLRTVPSPGSRALPEQDLPEGSTDVEPISRVGNSMRKAGHELAEAMRPLVPVLDSIHQSISQAKSRPEEITVEMGVTLSGDLRLMVVGGKADATFTVSATWRLPGA